MRRSRSDSTGAPEAGAWRCLAEFPAPGPEALAGRLAAALRPLALPAGLGQRMLEALALAVQSARDQDARAEIVVRVLATPAGAARNWGFFQLRRAAEGPGRRREIEVCVFAES